MVVHTVDPCVDTVVCVEPPGGPGVTMSGARAKQPRESRMTYASIAGVRKPVSRIVFGTLGLHTLGTGHE